MNPVKTSTSFFFAVLLVVGLSFFECFEKFLDYISTQSFFINSLKSKVVAGIEFSLKRACC